jgi:hypothetical protein
MCAAPKRSGTACDAFVDIGGDRGDMPREEAEAFLGELETPENRYRPDVWG